jgi:DNA-binding MarR family transcriptional regulator
MKKHEHLYQMVWMSRPLMQAAEACVEQGLAATGLTVRTRAVLEILAQYGELTVPEIALRLEINRQYVQVMVNEALASGFAEQRPNPRHRRSPLLALTNQGQELINRVISQEMTRIEAISADFTEAEIATALHVVAAVTAKLKAQVDKKE